MSLGSLSELPLFAGLSAAETSELESRMRRREYAPQQTIVREGGAGDAAYLIVSGLVVVRHKDPDSGVDFLAKPFTLGVLAAKVRAILDRR